MIVTPCTNEQCQCRARTTTQLLRALSMGRNLTGVNCDSCMRGNFKGRRYKCLVCYDYDLCSTCYEAGVATTERSATTTERSATTTERSATATESSAITIGHSADHAMQCILTKAHLDLFYGGDATSLNRTQSFTCPYCSDKGFSEVTLFEHVASAHSDATAEVICPICAASPGGDPNLVTDDFQDHLDVEHRGILSETARRRTQQVPRLAVSAGGSRPRWANNTQSSALSREHDTRLSRYLSSLYSRDPSRLGQQQSLNRYFGAERPSNSFVAPSVAALAEQYEAKVAAREAGLPDEAALHATPAFEDSDTGTPQSSASAQAAASSNSNQPKTTLLSKYLAKSKPIGRDLEEKERTEAAQSLFIQEVLLATFSDAGLPLQNPNEAVTSDTAGETDEDSNKAAMLDTAAKTDELVSQLVRSSNRPTDDPAQSKIDGENQRK